MSSNENTLEERILYIETSGYALTAIVGVILNGIIIVTVRYTARPYVCTRLALHLSVANLFGCAFVILLQGFGDTWLLRNNACAMVLIFKSLWLSSAVIMTSFLVYEGIIKLRYRIKQLNNKNVESSRQEHVCLSLNFTLALVWLGAGMIGLFTLFSIKINGEKWLCLTYQHMNKYLTRFYLAFIVALPLTILVCMYVYYKRLLQNHQRSIGTYERDNRRKNIQREIHYMKSSFYVSHVLLITWLPHVVYTFCLIDWFVDNIRFNETTYHMLKLVQWVCYTSCLVQPVVILNTNYQIKLKVKRKAIKIWYKLCGSPKLQKTERLPHTGSTVTEIQTLSLPNIEQHNNSFTRQTIEPTHIEVQPTSTSNV